MPEDIQSLETLRLFVDILIRYEVVFQSMFFVVILYSYFQRIIKTRIHPSITERSDTESSARSTSQSSRASSMHDTMKEVLLTVN